MNYMTEDVYRISKNREEILKVLNSKFTGGNRFIVWQKMANEKNERIFKTTATFESMNLIEGQFTMRLGENEKSKFDKNLDTYFLLEGEDFAFKSKLSIVQPGNGNIVTFQAPKEVRLKELRANPRIYYDSNDFRNVHVTFDSKKEDEGALCTTCRIFNISKTGICIIVTKETFCTINLHGKIELEGLGFFNSLENVKVAIVRNARIFSKKSLKSDESFAIGLEFQT